MIGAPTNKCTCLIGSSRPCQTKLLPLTSPILYGIFLFPGNSLQSHWSNLWNTPFLGTGPYSSCLMLLPPSLSTSPQLFRASQIKMLPDTHNKPFPIPLIIPHLNTFSVCFIHSTIMICNGFIIFGGGGIIYFWSVSLCILLPTSPPHLKPTDCTGRATSVLLSILFLVPAESIS